MNYTNGGVRKNWFKSLVKINRKINISYLFEKYGNANWDLPNDSVGKDSASSEVYTRPLGWKDPLKKKMAPHSSILAWSNPWTEEPSGLQSVGSQRVALSTLNEVDNMVYFDWVLLVNYKNSNHKELTKDYLQVEGLNHLFISSLILLLKKSSLFLL